MSKYGSNCGCGCATKFDSVKICDKLSVKGDTVLKAVEAKSLCFADNGLDGKKWCVSEHGSTNALDFFYDGVKKVSLSPLGDVELEGVVAESTETLTLPVVPTSTNCSVNVTTTFLINAVNQFINLSNGKYDGQVKRIVPLVPGQIFTVNFNNPVEMLSNNNSAALVFQWSKLANKWIVYSKF